MVTEANAAESSVKNNNPLPVKSNMLTSDIDIEKIFFIIIRRWPLIILSAILSYLAANIYLRYATPKYSAGTRVLIKDTKASGGMSEATIFQDLGILNTGRNLDNEVEILKTSFLMEEVVRKLNLQYTYESQGRLKSREVYKESPFVVLAWEPYETFENKTVQIEVTQLKKDQIQLVIDGKKINGTFGQAIKTPYGQVTIGSPEYRSKVTDSKNILITIKSIATAASLYSKSLSVSLDAKTRSTVLQLSFTDVSPNRAIDVLKALIDVYNSTEVADKNRVYENTVEFIDNRMTLLGDELRTVESDVADFRAKNNAVNLSGEGALLLGESSQSNREIAALDAQLEMARAIKNQLNKEGFDFSIVPTSESLTSPALASLLNTFNQLILERERTQKLYGNKNPEIEIIEKQLTNLRLNILENISVAERDMMVRRDMLDTQSKSITTRIKTLPGTEKQLLEIQRQQQIKQELYLYLLQKREEAALSLSVTVANNRVIEPPRFNGQVAPKEKIIRLFSISFGILFPVLVLLFLQAINKKVMNEDQIIKNCSVPILGTIPFAGDSNNVIVSEGKRSAGAEMFRLVRANLQFVGEGSYNKVLLFTSSISGEGKSFISINLGLTLALAKKKVILIELDMRKPKLAKYLGITSGGRKGITDYLVDENISLDDITRDLSYHENLKWIPCGNLPPNPSELILSERLRQLFEQLRNLYDYVLIDTPPVGLVSDALLLNKLVDTSVYVVRQGVTEIRQLKVVQDINDNNKLPRPYIIFNGVKFGSGGYGYGTGYGYGYGYNYGYGYGYYSDDQKKKRSIWGRIMGK
jgi:capsular exopolysaccharide synthesis family protein